MVGKRHLRIDEILDQSGQLRVIFRTPNWEDFVHLAFSEIRSCGSNNLQIVRRLRAMIANLIQTLPAQCHPPLQQELSLLDREITRSILRLSIPSGVATVAVMTGFALFSMIVSRLDTSSGAQLVQSSCPSGHAEAVNGAATTVIVGILKLTFTACLAFGTSTATLVSQSLGERDGDRAARFGWASVRLGLAVFGVVGLLEGVLFPHQLLGIFTSSDAVAHAALLPMRLMGICTPIIAVAMILSQALFGAGNTLFVMVVELILHFTCLVPLAWLLGITLDYGLVGIWSAAITYILLLAATMTAKFAKGDWKTIQI